MIRGNIAIPTKDPKTWRSRGRKKPRTYPENMPAIIEAKPKQRKGPVIRLSEQQQANDNGATPSDDRSALPRRSAIVEPKRKPSMLDHDGSEEEHRRRGDLAMELFRKIAGAASKPG